MITKSISELIKFVMNNQPISLNQVSKEFNHTPQYVRNEIFKANSYLNPKYDIQIKNSIIDSNINYNDYLEIMKSLTFDTYAPNQTERFNTILVSGYFFEYVNLTTLYLKWGLSLTTKKRDIQILESKLKKLGLNIQRKPGMGVSIHGDTLKYRVLISGIINSCLDVFDLNISRRLANSPVENDIYDLFESRHNHLFEDAYSLIRNFLYEYQHDVGYYSKKFFLTYTLIALNKPSHHNLEIKSLCIKPLNLYLFEDKTENRAFNQVASMIDFDPIVPMPYNKELRTVVIELVHQVAASLNITLFNDVLLIEEMYTFVYRLYFIHYFGYQYEDKLVKKPELVYPKIVESIINHKHLVEDMLNLSLNDEQITSLTLIFAKWVSMNQLHGLNAKKIVLVTNVSSERIQYFLESLSRSIDYVHVKTLDINEIELLSSLNFDLILSFSKRITSILLQRGYNATQVKFFMDHHDLETLYNHGCNKASLRIDTNHFIEFLKNSDKQNIKDTIRAAYPHIFL